MQATDLMPRTRVNFRLDDRILEELEILAGKGKINQFVEGVLFEFLKNTGRLPKDAEPLPEARGGKRPGAGKPKKSSSDTDQDIELKTVISNESDLDNQSNFEHP